MLTVNFSLCVQSGDCHQSLPDDHAPSYVLKHNARGRGPWSQGAHWKLSISGQKCQYSTTTVLSIDLLQMALQKQQKVATNQQKVATNQQKVATNQQKVATNQQKVATNQQKVATNQQKVATNQQKVATNQQKVATNQQKVANNQQKTHTPPHVPL